MGLPCWTDTFPWFTSCVRANSRYGSTPCVKSTIHQKTIEPSLSDWGACRVRARNKMNVFDRRVVQGKEAEETNRGLRAGLEREGEYVVNPPYAEFGFV